jgi:hypothetical protein
MGSFLTESTYCGATGRISASLVNSSFALFHHLTLKEEAKLALI